MNKTTFEARFKQLHEELYADEHERKKQEWVLAGIRAHTRWGEGKEVTDAEFEEAYDAVTNMKIGGGPPPESLPNP